MAKPEQYYNQYELRLLDRDDTEYDFRLRLNPRSQKLVEYSPEFDDFTPEASKVNDEPVKTTVVPEKPAVNGRGSGGRTRGSRTKTLKVSRPSTLSSKHFLPNAEGYLCQVDQFIYC